MHVIAFVTRNHRFKLMDCVCIWDLSVDFKRCFPSASSALLSILLFFFWLISILKSFICNWMFNHLCLGQLEFSSVEKITDPDQTVRFWIFLSIKLYFGISILQTHSQCFISNYSFHTCFNMKWIIEKTHFQFQYMDFKQIKRRLGKKNCWYCLLLINITLCKIDYTKCGWKSSNRIDKMKAVFLYFFFYTNPVQQYAINVHSECALRAFCLKENCVFP